jgi:hypothetical protein
MLLRRLSKQTLSRPNISSTASNKLTCAPKHLDIHVFLPVESSKFNWEDPLNLESQLTADEVGIRYAVL